MLNVLYGDLTWWEEIHSWNGSIANSHHTLLSVNVDSCEGVEVIEEGSVWGSHGELNLG